jgi:hypothetical protein
MLTNRWLKYLAAAAGVVTTFTSFGMGSVKIKELKDAKEAKTEAESKSKSRLPSGEKLGDYIGIKTETKS